MEKREMVTTEARYGLCKAVLSPIGAVRLASKTIQPIDIDIRHNACKEKKHGLLTLIELKNVPLLCLLC